MPDAISFNAIPTAVFVPGQYIEYSNARAIRGTPDMPNRILLVVQMFASGSALPGQPLRIFSSSSPNGLFGQGSMAARAVAAAIAANSITELWVLPVLDNPAGAAAAGAVLFGGAVTAAGTFALYIGGDVVQIAVAAAATLASLATALAAAINALPDLAVTAAVDGVNTAKVNLTLKWKGLTGNDLDIRVSYYDSDALPPGLTATVTAMAGGAGNPDLTAAIGAMGDTWYTYLGNPYRDGGNLTLLGTELVRRWGPMVQKDCFSFTAVPGSTGALAAFGLTQNNQLMNFPAVRGPTPSWIWTAVEAAIHAYYLNIDPARPTHTLVLPGILAPRPFEQLVWNDRQQLLAGGIATHKVDASRNVMIERSITSYRVNAAGITDRSYLDIQTLATLAYFRWSERARIAQLYPRFKLGDDTDPPRQGNAIARPKDVAVALVALAAEWEEDGLLEDLDQFKANLIVVRDSNDPNRLNALSPPNIVGQFLVFAGQIAFSL